MVAPDEVPYLLDLHLFLGRALTLARPHEEPTGKQRLGQGWGPSMVPVRRRSHPGLGRRGAGFDIRRISYISHKNPDF